MNDIFLSAHDIVKRYAEHTALSGVSIDVPRGKIFGLIGPNGAGKTTLIRIINRITMPDEGTVTFDGHPSTAADLARIGYLPEERGLYKKMKVGEQAVYLAMLRGLTRGEATSRLVEWFERFGIMPWWDKKLEELSKGMQQKVQFVITVLHRPELLILDEPFSGFDPVNAELLKSEILRLRDEGATVIFSTHNMASVEEICDDVALVNRSRIVLTGHVDDVRSAHRTGTFEVSTTAGTLEENAAAYRILSSERVGTLTTFRLSKAEGLTNSQLAAAVAEQAELRSFREVMPSMQEIFLKTVGEEAPSDAAQPAAEEA